MVRNLPSKAPPSPEYLEMELYNQGDLSVNWGKIEQQFKLNIVFWEPPVPMALDKRHQTWIASITRIWYVHFSSLFLYN
jgi:hypothetical protein